MQDHEREDRKLRDTEIPFGEDEQGATLIEYGMVVGLIALASIVTMTSLKSNIATLMSAIGSQLTSST